MNVKLLRSCACLWLVGLFAMWILRALFELEAEALAFQLAARLFFVGGVGYTGLGVLGLVSEERPARPVAPPAHADLSALIRRR